VAVDDLAENLVALKAVNGFLESPLLSNETVLKLKKLKMQLELEIESQRAQAGDNGNLKVR
jgi:hypothetical protein